MFGEVKEAIHPVLGKVISLPELKEARQAFNTWARWDYKWGQEVGDQGDVDWDDIVFEEKKEN